jgi:hypothetical protein
MVSMPLMLMLGLATFYLVRKSSAKALHMAVAVLFGLTLAGTSVGSQILAGAETATTSVVNGISHSVGSGGGR